MEKHEVEEYMRKRGYSKVMECQEKGKTISIVFTNMPSASGKVSSVGLPVPVYSVNVWLDSLNYQFVYGCEKSINKLVSPECGAFETEHFEKLAKAFEKDASVLYRYS